MHSKDDMKRKAKKWHWGNERNSMEVVYECAIKNLSDPMIQSEALAVTNALGNNEFKHLLDGTTASKCAIKLFGNK